MRRIKIGIIGAGHMWQLAHLLNYVQLPEMCEIVSLCDVKINQAQHLANQWGIPHVTADYKELLANPDIEAVLCVQHFENHVVLVPEILKAGKHVFTEKPLCVFPHNAETLAQLAKESGKIHMVGYHKRSDPAVEHALKVITQWKQSGEFGKMTYVRLCMPPGNYRKDADMHYTTNEPPGYVPEEPRPDGMDDATRHRMIWFVNYYIHQVNLMRYLMGEDYEMTYADRYFLSTKSQSGVNGILELDTYETSVDWQEHALVCFEKAWLRIDLTAPLATQLAGTVTIYKDKGANSTFEHPVMPNVCPMRNQAKNFLLAVAGEKPVPCLSAEAVKDLQIAAEYIKRTDASGHTAVPYHQRNIMKIINK